MTIQIIVNIEAGESWHCGACHHSDMDECCDIFPGFRAFDGYGPLRLPDCLAAERKLKDLVEAASYFSICRSESEIEQTEANRIDLRQALAAIKEPNHAE